jgi:hypothetical protein
MTPQKPRGEGSRDRRAIRSARHHEDTRDVAESLCPKERDDELT